MPSKSRTTFAQSSDVRARSLSQYRFDMKKKAILELEVLEWLEGHLKSRNPGARVSVGKWGGDAAHWFGRDDDSVRGDPDYKARIDDRVDLYELQSSEGDGLKFFDFKVSKVGPKVRGRRIPYEDRRFLYVVKSPPRFRFLTPAWVFENGSEGAVPAWGNRIAFRVPRDKFLVGFREDGRLGEALERVALKARACTLPRRWLRFEADALSDEVEDAFARASEFRFVPRSAGGLHRACLVLRHAEREPEDPAEWLRFLFSLRTEEAGAEGLARLVLALDFLYLCIPAGEFPEDLRPALVDFLRSVRLRIEALRPAPGGAAPGERECAALLFAADAYEDIAQYAVQQGDEQTPPIMKIYQTLGDEALRALAPPA